MKKALFALLFLIIIFGLTASLTGCAALKKKFTPKAKPKPKQAYFTEVKRYDLKPSPELYEKHYIFWVNWHKKLVSEFGENHKSDMRSIQEMLANLEDMAALLVDEKADYLKLRIEELEKAKTILEKNNLTILNETRIRRIVEKEYRNIRRDFPPSKMSDCIRDDWR